MPVPVFDNVMVPELLRVATLMMVPLLNNVMVPELLMAPPLSTVIVTPGSMLSSTPELMVQVSPFAMVCEVVIVVSTANVIGAACASGMANMDNVKIRAKTER